MKKTRTFTDFNLKLVFALTLGSITFGYGFSIPSTTLDQPGFYDFFNLTQVPTAPGYAFTNTILGAMNACFSCGGLFGVIFVSWAADSLGRKKTLLIATPIAILAGALQAGAVHIAMFLIGRLIGGFAIGMLVVIVPLFQAEIAPPSVRGFLVSQHAVIIALGYSTAGWIGTACYYSRNTAFQWRFPLSLQCLWPLVLLALTPSMPESPRWLLAKGRNDEAWIILKKLHETNDISNVADEDCTTFAQKEFQQMSEQISRDVDVASSETVWTLFTKASYRRKMLVAFIMFLGAESTGILVIYNYSVLLYRGLGFSGSVPLVLAASWVTLCCVGNFINSLLIDRIGRVKLFLIGFSGCLVCLCFEAALSARYIDSTNQAGLSGGVFFLFLYAAFYGGCLDATTFVYCSEIFPTHIRARGVGWSLAILFLSTLIYFEVAPTAFAQVGWKFYLLFIFMTAGSIPLIYFLFPETKGLTLEEIGEKFGDAPVAHKLTSEGAGKVSAEKELDTDD